MFKGPQIFSSVHQEEVRPSGHEQAKGTETIGVPVFVTYHRGTRRLFVTATNYYLHKVWKGSHLCHQAIGKCYIHKDWKGLCLHQHNMYKTSLLIHLLQQRAIWKFQWILTINLKFVSNIGLLFLIIWDISKFSGMTMKLIPFCKMKGSLRMLSLTMFVILMNKTLR